MRERQKMMADEKEFEAAITRALEQQPAVRVPVDFAARVRSALPAQPTVRSRRFGGPSVAQTAAAVAVLGLVAALCVLAPHVRPSFDSLAFDMEMVLLLELCGVAAWLGTARSRD
jgi:hypothetical protein